MNTEAENGIGDSSNADLPIGDGDWNYLREHLDHPRFLSIPLGVHLSPQSLGGLGARLTGWLMHRWRNLETPRTRLATMARLQVGQRQALLLVEADGTRVLVGTSADGAPSFCPLPLSSNLNPKWIAAGGTSSDFEETATLRSFDPSNWDGTMTQTPNTVGTQAPRRTENKQDLLHAASVPPSMKRRNPSRGRRANIAGRVSW